MKISSQNIGCYVDNYPGSMPDSVAVAEYNQYFVGVPTECNVSITSHDGAAFYSIAAALNERTQGDRMIPWYEASMYPPQPVSMSFANGLNFILGCAIPSIVPACNGSNSCLAILSYAGSTFMGGVDWDVDAIKAARGTVLVGSSEYIQGFPLGVSCANGSTCLDDYKGDLRAVFPQFAAAFPNRSYSEGTSPIDYRDVPLNPYVLTSSGKVISPRSVNAHTGRFAWTAAALSSLAYVGVTDSHIDRYLWSDCAVSRLDSTNFEVYGCSNASPYRELYSIYCCFDSDIPTRDTVSDYLTLDYYRDFVKNGHDYGGRQEPFLSRRSCNGDYHVLDRRELAPYMWLLAAANTSPVVHDMNTVGMFTVHTTHVAKYMGGTTDDKLTSQTATISYNFRTQEYTITFPSVSADNFCVETTTCSYVDSYDSKDYAEWWALPGYPDAVMGERDSEASMMIRFSDDPTVFYYSGTLEYAWEVLTCGGTTASKFYIPYPPTAMDNNQLGSEFVSEDGSCSYLGGCAGYIGITGCYPISAHFTFLCAVDYGIPSVNSSASAFDPIVTMGSRSTVCTYDTIAVAGLSSAFRDPCRHSVVTWPETDPYFWNFGGGTTDDPMARVGWEWLELPCGSDRTYRRDSPGEKFVHQIWKNKSSSSADVGSFLRGVASTVVGDVVATGNVYLNTPYIKNQIDMEISTATAVRKFKSLHGGTVTFPSSDLQVRSSICSYPREQGQSFVRMRVEVVCSSPSRWRFTEEHMDAKTSTWKDRDEDGKLYYSEVFTADDQGMVAAPWIQPVIPGLSENLGYLYNPDESYGMVVRAQVGVATRATHNFDTLRMESMPEGDYLYNSNN